MERMGTQQAADTYRGRKALGRTSFNAIIKATMGMRKLPVRGLERVEGLMVIVAIMINLHEHRRIWLN